MYHSHDSTKAYWEIMISLWTKIRFHTKWPSQKVTIIYHIFDTSKIHSLTYLQLTKMKLKLLFLSVGIQLSRNVWHLVGSVWSSLGTSQNRERVKIGNESKSENKSKPGDVISEHLSKSEKGSKSEKSQNHKRKPHKIVELQNGSPF